MKKVFKPVVILIVLALIWASGILLDSELEKRSPQKIGGPTTYDAVFSGESLKVMSLGYDSAMTIYYWMKFIQYVSNCGDYKKPMDNLYRMVDVITTIDPRFAFAYEMAWIFLMNYDVRPIEVRIEEGAKILEKGWRYNPDSWRMAQNRAFHLFFYQQEYRMAANLYDTAYRLKKPPFVIYARLAARLRANAGYPELALIGLRVQLQSTDDEETKKSIIEHIKKTEAEIKATGIDKAIAMYMKELNVDCPADLDELVKAGYLETIPPDGLGGTFVIDTEKCISKSTTVGRLQVYQPKNKESYFK